MAPDRSKLHHFHAQLVLRGFANADGRVRTVNRETGTQFVQPTSQAGAVNHYNTLNLDGVEPDAGEQAMSDIEAAAAIALRHLEDTGTFATDQQKYEAALFLALEYTRVPVRRDFHDSMADELMKLQMAASGPAGIREAMEQAGMEPTDADVAEQWEQLRDFDSWGVRLTQEHHVSQTIDLAIEGAGSLAEMYSWTLTRWKRRAVLTCDSPVMLGPRPGQPEWLGTGLATAGTISFALSRHCVLTLINRDVLDVPDGLEKPGSLNDARRFNQSTANHSQTWMYLHPDDAITDLLGPDWTPTPSAEVRAGDEHGRKVRDSLAAMNDYHLAHPDEPHPASRLPPVPEPPPDARPPSGR